MKTYPIVPGSKLVFSVDCAPWEPAPLQAADFADPEMATAEELAATLNRFGSLACSAAADGTLLLASASRGDTASIEIDGNNSTAAPARGLGTGGAAAQGSGSSAARLVGQAKEPFALPAGATMSITVDGAKSTITFKGLPRTAQVRHA